MIRSNPIYLSTEVWRWLRLLAKAESNKPTKDGSGTYDPQVGTYLSDRKFTPDEIADTILRQAIREQHPTLAEHQKKIDKLEKELIEELQRETKH